MLALLGFLATVLLIIIAVHLYLWKRLVRDTTTAKTRARRLGGLAILLLAVAIPVTIIGSRTGPRWLAWGYVWVALMFYLLVTLLALELPMLAARLWLRRRTTGRQPATAPAQPGSAQPAAVLVAAGTGDGEDGLSPRAGSPAPAGPGVGEPPTGAALVTSGPVDHDPGRRLILARGAAIFAGLTATGVTGYGIRTALGPPRLDRVVVPLPGLPPAMDGLRIAVVGDMHVGPISRAAHTERVVAEINRLDADLVAMVGDLVDGDVPDLAPEIAALRNLRSRYGTFFVTGNHEYYSGVEQWLPELPRLGLRVLANERVELDGLDLAGVHDVTGEGMSGGLAPDYAAALGDRDRSRPVVLLAHQPVQAHEAARYGVGLQLSGHTHGGQLAPFNLLVRLQQPVVSGLGEVDGTKVYVTNGSGFWGPPVRVGAPPQVSLVQLRTP